MDKINIKKALYKQKPMATFRYIRMGVAYYSAVIADENDNEYTVNFEIPVGDMGEADFGPEMDGKYLNRWIVG